MFRLSQSGVQHAGLFAIATALSGCSVDDTGDSLPRGPEDSFAIARVGTVSHVVETSGAELQVSCAEPLMVWVAPSASWTLTTLDAEGNELPPTWVPPDPSTSRFQLGDFKLAPPNGCGGEVDCGWIELQVAPPAEATSSEPSKYLAAQPVIRVGAPASGNWAAGIWTFRVHLIDSTNTAVMSKETNKPLAAEFVVNVAPIGTCEEAAN